MNLGSLIPGRKSFSGPSRTLGQTTQISINNGSFLGRIMSRGSGSTSSEPVRALEEVIDMESDIDIFKNNEVQLLNPRILYQTGILNFSTSLLRTTREEHVFATTEAVNLDIISKTALQDIKRSKKTLVHIGLIMIGIKGLTRKYVGAKTLIVILDKSWQTDVRKATIATMEVDMDKNEGLVYCSPDIMLPIADLDKIVIGIQTRGYEDLSRNKGNLFIRIGLLGRLTNTSNIQYKLNIDGMTKMMASKGIKCLEPMKINSSELEGLEWNLNKNLENTGKICVPEQSNMFKNRDGTYSLRFSQYKELPQKESDLEENE